MGIVASGLVYTTGACMWLHLGVNKLQRLVLLPRVFTLQWLELALDCVYTRKASAAPRLVYTTETCAAPGHFHTVGAGAAPELFYTK
jgi:hypothetical protein